MVDDRRGALRGLFFVSRFFRFPLPLLLVLVLVLVLVRRVRVLVLLLMFLFFAGTVFERQYFSTR
jgi:hypothetical protein